MKIIDMHCDTVYALPPDEGLRTHSGHISLEKLKQGGCLAQFFALFTSKPPKRFPQSESPCESYEDLLAIFRDELSQNAGLIRLARRTDDIRANEKLGLMSAVLSMEDAAPAEGDIRALDRFYADGVRVLGLIWNYENELAYPNSEDSEIMKKPLKPFGEECVRRANKLGMALDVSHLNDGGFEDVCRISEKPFFATHSNARAITPSPRNLTDSQLKKLGEKGGVAGLNYYSGFLNSRGKDEIETADMLRHAKHIVNTAGEDALGLGSDFDGIHNRLPFCDYSGMPQVICALSRVFSPSQMDKICFGNALRVLKECEQ